MPAYVVCRNGYTINAEMRDLLTIRYRRAWSVKAGGVRTRVGQGEHSSFQRMYEHRWCPRTTAHLRVLRKRPADHVLDAVSTLEGSLIPLEVLPCPNPLWPRL